jgi:hypothetical protein
LSVEAVIEVSGARVHRVPDRYRVALIIEGGGSRGMFSAGMRLGLEELGLESVFVRCTGRAAGLPGKRVGERVKCGVGEDDHEFPPVAELHKPRHLITYALRKASLRGRRPSAQPRRILGSKTA